MWPILERNLINGDWSQDDLGIIQDPIQMIDLVDKDVEAAIIIIFSYVQGDSLVMKS